MQSVLCHRHGPSAYFCCCCCLFNSNEFILEIEIAFVINMHIWLVDLNGPKQKLEHDDEHDHRFYECVISLDSQEKM